MAELERKKAAWTEEQRVEAEKSDVALHAKQTENEVALHAKQMESEATIHTEWIRSDEKQKDTNAKWMAWMNQLQVDQAKKQKEASDDYMRHIADLNQQHAQQDEQYGELQRRLHVSESSVQPTVLYQSHGNPSVSVCAPPPPPSVSQQLPPMPHPCMLACVS